MTYIVTRTEYLSKDDFAYILYKDFAWDRDVSDSLHDYLKSIQVNRDHLYDLDEVESRFWYHTELEEALEDNDIGDMLEEAGAYDWESVFKVLEKSGKMRHLVMVTNIKKENVGVIYEWR